MDAWKGCGSLLLIEECEVQKKGEKVNEFTKPNYSRGKCRQPVDNHSTPLRHRYHHRWIRATSILGGAAVS